MDETVELECVQDILVQTDKRRASFGATGTEIENAGEEDTPLVAYSANLTYYSDREAAPRFTVGSKYSFNITEVVAE